MAEVLQDRNRHIYTPGEFPSGKTPWTPWHTRNVRLTREELQRRKDQAVEFTENARDDPERASEIESESLEDYAAQRGIEPINAGRTRSMANGGNGRTKQDLLDEIDDLQQEN